MNNAEHSSRTGWFHLPVLRAFPALLLLLTPLNAVAAELTPLAGERPPALSLKDLSGKRHDLSGYRGKVILVNFWASWCSPCLTEMPAMRRLATAMRDRPFRILAVNVGETKSQVWRFRKLLDLNFPTLLDGNGEVGRAWQVNIFPTSYVIDTNGRIRYRGTGALDWGSQALREKIDLLISESENSVSTKRQDGPTIRLP